MRRSTIASSFYDYLSTSSNTNRFVTTGTNRAACSFTFGKYLFDLFIAPSSQIFEHPQNPGRFILF